MIETISGDSLTLTAPLVDSDTGTDIAAGSVSTVWVQIGSLYEWTLLSSQVTVETGLVKIALSSAETAALDKFQKVFIKVQLSDGRTETIVQGEYIKFTTTPLTDDY